MANSPEIALRGLDGPSSATEFRSEVRSGKWAPALSLKAQSHDAVYNICGVSRSKFPAVGVTSWNDRSTLRKYFQKKSLNFNALFGAGDGDRTHDIQLGKLTFYR